MSFLKKYAADMKEEFMSNVSDEIKALVKSGKVIELSEFTGMRMNSYERRLLTPLFSGELLRQQIEYCLSQEPGGRKTHKYALSSGYHNAVLGEFLPELLRRLNWKSPEKNPPPARVKVKDPYPGKGMNSYRVYVDGAVVFQDDYEEEDMYVDCTGHEREFDEYVIPDELVDHIADSACPAGFSFNPERKK